MRHLILSLMLVGNAAQASPPNAVTISDIYLGANADHVFLLRTIDDNLGRNSPAALDLFLIARARSGMDADEVWPIRRKIDYGDWEESADEDVAIPDAADPFAIMASRDAWPGGMDYAEGLPDIIYDEDSITFITTSLEGWDGIPLKTQFKIPLTTVIRQLDGGHTATRTSLAQYPGMNGGTDAYYHFNETTFANECTPQTSGHLRDADGEINTLLVEFSCVHPDERYIHARVYLLVPATAENF